MRLRWVAVACAAGLSSGCASVNGMPKPVLSTATVNSMIDEYRPDQAIERMGLIAATDRAGRNTYRNRVVMAYLTAIDARYDDYRRGLSRAGKAGHLAADTVVLGLTGLGAILDGAAAELSAGATAVGGMRSSFDKEVFIGQALPVLVSFMDSKRLAVRADIMRGLSQDESVYTIEEAFSDLMRYQSAGNIDAAVQDASAKAAEQANAAQYDYGKAIELCTLDAATDQARRKLMGKLQAIALDATGADPAKASAARKQLQAAGGVVGNVAADPASTREAALAQLVPVRDVVDTLCDTASVTAFAAKLQAAGVSLT